MHLFNILHCFSQNLSVHHLESLCGCQIQIYDNGNVLQLNFAGTLTVYFHYNSKKIYTVAVS